MRTLCCVVLLFTCVACAARQNVLLATYKNRGPLPVSSTNEYMAANRLLSAEMERNAVLQGFVKEAGMPQAIEVRKRMFGPYRLYLHYPERNKTYFAEQRSGDWLITGPEALPEDVIEKLGSVSPASDETAPSETAGEAPSEVSSTPAPPANVTAYRVTEPVEDSSIKSGETESVDLKKTRPAAPPVEQTAKSSHDGDDVLHTVTFEGETLRLISEWYTGSRENAPALAAHNHLKNPHRITLGDLIKIPRNLVQRDAPLPLQEVDRYQTSVQNERKNTEAER